jgi:hypothetical protein
MRDDRDPEEPGFQVHDRRQFTAEGTPTAAPEEPARPAASSEPARPAAPAPDASGAPPRSPRPTAPLPEIDFATFVLSLTTSALFHLGEMPRPDTNTTEKNLPLAKQTIDIIAMLKDKTTGNLGADETQLVDNLLYDLRLKYVQATR